VIIKTPHDVSEYVSFKQGDYQWVYQSADNKSQKDMASLQAEGVAGLINRLKKYNVALLADEVGTGKTFQALTVAARKLFTEKNSRVLVLTPRQTVADQWPQEFDTLVKYHFKNGFKESFAEFEIPVLERMHSTNSKDNPSQHWVKNAPEMKFADGLKKSRLIVGKFSSFSYLKPKDNDTLEEEKRKAKIVEELGQFDLIIIDEAHYFRLPGSNRYETAKDLFEKLSSKDVQFLLLSATPTHSSSNDICQILEVIGKSSDLCCKQETEFDATEIFKKIAIRRFRRLTNKEGKGLTKLHYRKGISIPSSFKTDPNSELFYAMYQKMLVECAAQKSGRQKSSLKHYLEGIEFDPQTYLSLSKKSLSGKGDDKHPKSTDYKQGHDSKILVELLNAYKKTFKELPSNPKYRSTVDAIWKCIWSDDPSQTEKVLVFSRRIASTKELSAQIIQRYDYELWQMIISATDINKAEPVPKSREMFQELLKNMAKDHNSEDGEHKGSDGDLGKTLPQESKILNMFREQEHGLKTTVASDFRKLFRLDKAGPFAQFFKIDSNQSIFILLAKTLPENVISKFDKPVFAKLIKKAVLQASIGVVELFCCYLRSNTRRYDDFFSEVEKSWDKFRFRHEVELMIEQYEVFYEKFISAKDKSHIKTIDEKGSNAWNMFNQAAPAFAYTGETKNDSVIKRFNAPFFPKVLVATSVLQEGVNLQLNCRKVMHYGHAWTPGDDEQRIGRVDRMMGMIARKLEVNNHETLDILYPFLEKTHDENALKSFLKKKKEVSEKLDQLKSIQSESDSLANENTVNHLSIDELLSNPIDPENQIDIIDPYSA
jgi:superfamily II DNA or RNA helicase